MQADRFPYLAKLAKKYLAVSATSTQAERAFSKLGLLLTKRRLAMDGENVNKILFLSDKIDKNYLELDNFNILDKIKFYSRLLLL